MPNFDDLMDKDNAPKKKKKAVALQYEHNVDPAPRISAKGEGEIAEQIIAIAAEHGINIHEDKDLVEILSVLETESFIPLEAYVAVAEIMSYIYNKNASIRGEKP